MAHQIIKTYIPAFAAALLILISTGMQSVSAQSFKTEEGKAVFHSRVPLHTFTGESDRLVGLINLETGTVDFYLDLATLETGIGKRDRDMKETLEVEEYPFAEFFGNLTTDFDPAVTDTQNVTVKGDFKIHGVEREVEISGKLLNKGDSLLLKAGWMLRLEDYDIIPPKLLFVKVDQEQKIEISAELKKQSND